MPEPTPDANLVRFARRFVAKIPGHPDVHGVEFPDGHVIADVPYQGLTAFLTVDYVIEGIEDATVHWADEPADADPTPKDQR